MNGKLPLSGLKEMRLLLGAGSLTRFARRARALFQRPEAGVTDRGSLAEFLARVRLFEHLDHWDRTRLARIVHTRDYADGESICEEASRFVQLFDAELGLVRLQRDELFAVVRIYKARGSGWQP